MEPCCCCTASPLQMLVGAVFGEKLCVANCNPVCLVEVVGSHAPSQRRLRLSCVVKPMGHRSGALLVVRGPAADVAKLCRGGPEALNEIARGGTMTEGSQSPGGCACSDFDDECEDRTNKSTAGSFEEGERDSAGSGRTRRSRGDAAHVRKVLLAAQQFSLEGWRPLLFAARALSAEELALYIQLSEEALNSMYRHEERHEQVITSFETNLQVRERSVPLKTSQPYLPPVYGCCFGSPALLAKGSSIVACSESLQLVGCVAVAEQLQPGVRETLATIREVGVRQVMLVGGDKHVALAAARRCGLLPAFDWSDASKAAAEEMRHFRPLGAMHHHHWDPLIGGTASILAESGCDITSHADQDQPQRLTETPLCRRCYVESHAAVHPPSEAAQAPDEVHSHCFRAWQPGSLHGLVTNAPASLSHWAVADAQHLLQRCAAELMHLAMKERRRLQRSPSASIWACECASVVPGTRLLRGRHRRLALLAGEGRRVAELPSQRSWDRQKRRERECSPGRRRGPKRQPGAGFISMRHRNEGQATAEEGVNLSALPLRRKLRVGRCFLRVFEEMWRQARAYGQGICLLSDVSSLSFFLSHKLLQVQLQL